MGVPVDPSARQGNVDLFVTFKTNVAGVVYGEASDLKYKGALEITGFSWGMSAHSEISSGNSLGRRQIKPLKLYKSIDAATMPLSSALAGNQVVTELTLTARKAGSNGPLEYLTIKIKNGRVIRQDIEYGEQIYGSNGNGREVVEISYQEIEINYTPQDSAGLSKGKKTFTDQYTSGQT